MMATVVPKKSKGTWMAKRLLAWMRELGCEQSDVIVKSDNEPSIVAVVNELGQRQKEEGRWWWRTAPFTAARAMG